MQVFGTVKPGFERVREEFERNFHERGEIGAACCVCLKGGRVVDLWAGYRDKRTKKPWNEDTMVCVFSTTKGMAAAATVVAHARGYFALDAPVARYWPEFEQHGKRDITVRQLFAHEAGLSAIDQKITPERIADLDAWAEVLARQSPQWEPGSCHGYHGLSLGFYQNELIRRTDPQRRSIGQFLHQEVATPLDTEFYIGLPKSISPDRIGTMEPFSVLDMFFKPGQVPVRMLLAMILPGSLTKRSLMNIDMKGPGDISHERWTSKEFPSASGVGSARGIASVLGALASNDPALRLGPATAAELYAPPMIPPGGADDVILKSPMAYSFGFIRPCPSFDMRFSEHAFGALGAGGSMSFGDPEFGVGFAYVMNRMSVHVGVDPRASALANAVYESIESLPPEFPTP